MVAIDLGGFKTYVSITLLLDLLLDLLLLDVVSALDVEDTVDVNTGLESADHEVVVVVGLDTLDGEAANPGVLLAGKQRRVGVAGLEVEGLLAVEGEDLGGGQHAALVKDGEAGVLVGDIRGLLPAKLDGVAANVLDGKVADAEDGGEDGAAKGATAGDGLVGVHGEGEGLAKEVLDALLESRDTGATADNLDNVNVVLGKLGLGEGGLEGLAGAVEERLNHGLKLLAGDHGVDIDVVHEGLDVDGGLLVGRQDLLGLLGGGNGTGHGAAVGADVDAVLGLELGGEVVDEGLVKVAATKVAIPGGCLDGELALLELDNGAGVVAVANVDEADALGLLLGAGEVELGDAPAEGGGGVVVDEAEELEAGQLGGVEEGAALGVGEPGGHAHAEVGDGELELGGGGLLNLAEVHADELGGCEPFLLAKVVDLGADLAVDVDEGGGDELLLGGDIGVVERAAGKALEAVDGVLEVGDFLCLGRLANVAALGAESDERAIAWRVAS